MFYKLLIVLEKGDVEIRFNEKLQQKDLTVEQSVKMVIEV